MAPPKKEKLPTMRELQDLLAALDAGGDLSIGGTDRESGNLDDLYKDSYFHAILHRTIKLESILVSTSPPISSLSLETEVPQSSINCNSTTESLPLSSSSTVPAPATQGFPKGTSHQFDVLTLPEECSWGDDHESLAQRLLIRPGYATVLTALLSAPSTPLPGAEKTLDTQSIFLATGSPGIGKSCLAYYLFYKLFEAGHDVVISDSLFTNAFVDRTYYSCYSPHLERHPAILQAITASSITAAATTAKAPKEKRTWWICDDGFLPVKGTKCNVLVTCTTAQTGQYINTIRRKNKLPMPVQFQISKWTIDEIKAGLIVSLASTLPHSSAEPTIPKEQEAVLETLCKEYKGCPRSIFAWVMENWTDGVTPQSENTTERTKTKRKTKKRA
ncbi:hypothetical protein BX616_009222 [Lobosporangium transversale]|uniref:Uncharacterized protein n=1 Tax=Lobosporangium transversale TaxID=64571 RepID=A0A1Y2H4K3_9FUNG|nr:hypothetical protein BCR41DRAFT_417785 [Lobosporangium transversale]KAF9913967.1 hypothetical protein BX616_009222 [Lobosporangium transversale]ORZ28643.1 hypothetical protein BCR41DRAFT_417785 [Lobosporangium transversale]|eukprot:XP_021886316.1 hypothetical protein BCR41DRAFT_417785 [Lobosporangium transversale]